MNTLSVNYEGSLATVRFNRSEARNTLNVEMMEELRDLGRSLQTNTSIHAVILTGDPVFSAGADLSDGQLGGAEQPPTKLELRETLKLGPDMCKAWEDIEAFTIAAIEGYCVGGAGALVAAFDHRIAAEDAFFRLPEIPLGINMSWQTIPRLVAQLGPTRAKQYVILGERVSAEKALDWGLCETVVDKGGTFDAAVELAGKIQRLPPIAVRMTKEAINRTANALANSSSFMDRDQYLLAVQTDDFAESVQAFLQKREPVFKGN